MPSRHTSLPALAASLLAAAVIGAGGGAAAYAVLASDGKTVVRNVTVGESAQPAAVTSGLSVGQIYRRSYKGVVEITVTEKASNSFPFGGRPQTQQGQGSGFVYDSAGHIVTNQHVAANADSISVRFWNGASYKATLVGSDASTDLALLKVDAPSSLLVPLQLGDSADVAVGDGVVAIGSPFGLSETVTSGIVSALHRQMTSPNGFSIRDSIQTDAAINHGNSGGPLLDTRGRVIGVNAQIRSDSGGSDGVGFAIPSSTVRSIVGQILADGKAEHAYLGVRVGTIPGSVAHDLGVPAGAELSEVKSGTPAARAGLHAATGSRTVDGQSYPTGGDVITAVNGKRITSSDELQAAIDAQKPGDTVSITYMRSGKRRTVRVELGTRPS
jgi:putative serine protease PepD